LGRTRFFTRYARSIAPWFHPPRWLFNIFLNAFLDQARGLVASHTFSCFFQWISAMLWHVQTLVEDLELLWHAQTRLENLEPL
jgi:hypothetical protein